MSGVEFGVPCVVKNEGLLVLFYKVRLSGSLSFQQETVDLEPSQHNNKLSKEI